MTRAGSLTNSHNDKEPRQEPPKVYYSTSRTLHEVIWIRCAPADPVRQGCDYIGCDDEQGKIVLEEGGAQDYEEEAYRKDLFQNVLANVNAKVK